jgi:hypothetical protein
MVPDQSTGTETKRTGHRHRGGRLRSLLRARVTAGLIIVLPIWVTILLVTFVFRLMRDASLWVVVGLLTGPLEPTLLQRWGVDRNELLARGLEVLPVGLQWGVGIFSVLLTIGLLYAIGVISTNIIGKRLVGTAESVVDRLPLVKTVYRACKQVLEAASRPRVFSASAWFPFRAPRYAPWGSSPACRGTRRPATSCARCSWPPPRIRPPAMCLCFAAAT